MVVLRDFPEKIVQVLGWCHNQPNAPGGISRSTLFPEGANVIQMSMGSAHPYGNQSQALWGCLEGNWAVVSNSFLCSPLFGEEGLKPPTS